MNTFYKILTIFFACLALFCFYLEAENAKLERAQETVLRKEFTEAIRVSDSTHQAQYTMKLDFINQKMNAWMDSVGKVQAQVLKSKAITKKTENEIDHLYLLRDAIHMHPDSLIRF